jgi:hypothetical protein
MSAPLPAQCCGTCRHWLPTRGKTGRVCPTQAGSCGWLLPQAWPLAYCDYNGTAPYITQHRVSWPQATGCKTWEAK